MEKTEGIQSPFVNTFLETLQTISKVQIKKSRKKEEESESDEEVDGNKEKTREVQQAEEEKMGNGKQTKRTGKKSRGGRSKKEMEENRIMEVEENEPEPIVKHSRHTRSQTKKKLK